MSSISAHQGMEDEEVVENGYRNQLTLPYKFQCIYIGDSEHTFKGQADRLLQILYQKSMSTGSAVSLLDKFKKEIEEMYRNSSAICNQEILIQFNESEYKVIPILEKQAKHRICYYSLANIPASINTLAGIVAHPSALMHNLEFSLYQYFSYLSINTNECSHWLWNISVRDLPIYRILYNNLIANNLDYYSSFAQNCRSSILSDKVLSTLINHSC